MKAMVFTKPSSIQYQPLQLIEIDKPIPKNFEILIRIEACGVCHTDLHQIEGDLRQMYQPTIPGHEIIGIVEELGPFSKKHNKGSRVGVTWLNFACRECNYCKNGLENLCDKAKFTGYHTQGGYTEFIAVHEDFAFQIPINYNAFHAAPLMCAGVIGYRSMVLSEISPGEKLGLFGFGASAHIVIQIANFWDCKTFVFTRSKNHQDHALKLGASWVGNSKEKPPSKIDRAITFAPVGTIVTDALSHVSKGGTVAVNAIYLTDIPSIPWKNLYFERKIKSVTNTTRNDAVEFLKIAAKIDIITEIKKYELLEANKALEDMKFSRFNGAAVLNLIE